MAHQSTLQPAGPPLPPRRSSRRLEKPYTQHQQQRSASSSSARTEHPFAKYRRSQLGVLTTTSGTVTSAQSTPASDPPAVISSILGSFNSLRTPASAPFELQGSDFDVDVPRSRRSSQRSSLHPPDVPRMRSASPLGTRSAVMDRGNRTRVNEDEDASSDSDAAVPPTVPTSRSFSRQSSSRPEQKTLKLHRLSNRQEILVSSDSFGNLSIERDDQSTRNKLSAESWVRQGAAEHEELSPASPTRSIRTLRRKESRESLRLIETKSLADTSHSPLHYTHTDREEQVFAKVLSPVPTSKERIYLSDSGDSDDNVEPPIPQGHGLAIHMGNGYVSDEQADLDDDADHFDGMNEGERTDRLPRDVNNRLSIADSIPTRTSSLARRGDKKSTRQSLLRTKTDDSLSRQMLEPEAHPVLEPLNDDDARPEDTEMLDVDRPGSAPASGMIPDSSWRGLSEEDSTVKRIRQLREMKINRMAEAHESPANSPRFSPDYDSDESPMKRLRQSNDVQQTVLTYTPNGLYERDIHTPNSTPRGPITNFSMPTPPMMADHTHNFTSMSDEYLADRPDQPLPTPARSPSPLSSGNASIMRPSMDVKVRSDSSHSPTPGSRRMLKTKSKNQRKINGLHPDLPEESGYHSRRRSLSDANYNTALRDSIEGSVNDYLRAPRLSRKVKDRENGRIICFSEVGDPEGNAVFICVGMGLTRYVTAFFDELASTLGLRLVTIDRPGVGGSQPYPPGDRRGPLNWSSDVLQVCQELGIEQFSLLAHSAGAVYALATALVLPEMVMGKIHLLAPWIPPSQLEAPYHPAASAQQAQGAGALPRSQRILRVLPASVFKAANSSFISTTSASLKPATKKQIDAVRAQQQRELWPAAPQPVERPRTSDANGRPNHARRESMMHMDQRMPTTTAEQSFGVPDEQAVEPVELRPDSLLLTTSIQPTDPELGLAATSLSAAEYIEKARKIEYTSRLTHRTWELATKESNPATDLLVCLERYRDIGFRYTDIDQPIVITHGTEDKRVPVGNVKWLAEQMNVRVRHNRDIGTPEPEQMPRSRDGWEYAHGPKGCEIRVLDGEDHGLMASASIMSDVLEEIAEYWRLSSCDV